MKTKAPPAGSADHPGSIRRPAPPCIAGRSVCGGEAARKRREAGERPYPLDNRVLADLGEELNPLETENPREPQRGLTLEVLEALRQHRGGLTAEELGVLLGRPERGRGGVRDALGNLRNRSYQPILMTPEGRFRLLHPGEY